MESENPDIQWALDLLKPDPLVQPKLTDKYYMQIPVFTIIPGAVCYANHSRGLRYFARPHYFAIAMGLGYCASLVVDWRFKSLTAKTDSVIRDYIIRHPEDFPPPERKRYGEEFTKWIPIR